MGRFLYPGLRYSAVSLDVEEDKVFVGLKQEGAVAPRPGQPHSHIFRICEGKIVEHWGDVALFSDAELVGIVTTYSSNPSHEIEGQPMAEQKNLDVVRRLWNEVINKHDLQQAHKIYIPDYVHHESSLPGKDIRGLDNYLNAIKSFFTAFPDLHLDIQDMLSQGDKVVTRWNMHGTHKADIMGTPATGKKVSVAGIVIHRVAAGKIVEGWVTFDALSMMQQLGAIPKG